MDALTLYLEIILHHNPIWVVSQAYQTPNNLPSQVVDRCPYINYTFMGYNFWTIFLPSTINKPLMHLSLSLPLSLSLTTHTPQIFFLNLSRLLPPKKVWKMFTNRLQIMKSHTRSRPIEKPKLHFKKLRWPILFSIQHKKFKLKTKSNTSLIHLNKLTPHVYAGLSTLKQHMHKPPRKEAKNKKSSYFKKRKESNY